MKNILNLYTYKNYKFELLDHFLSFFSSFTLLIMYCLVGSNNIFLKEKKAWRNKKKMKVVWVALSSSIALSSWNCGENSRDAC